MSIVHIQTASSEKLKEERRVRTFSVSIVSPIFLLKSFSEIHFDVLLFL
jgi:hypothetical protein